jgi:protein tyrosine/serine phosphatase
MANFAKTARRAMKQAASAGRNALQAHSPRWLKNQLGPFVSHFDMLFVDHGIFRLAYLNLHRIGDQAWRSAQPSPMQIARLKRMGIKTIVNLRGERACGSYTLEQQACAREGLMLETYRVKSRAAPTPAEVLGARELFKRIEYPMLMHCKSGADRVGLMSVLYLHFREGVPIAEAKSSLSLKYGHFRQADTGILDFFFERYLEDTRSRPKDFAEWVATEYDPEELRRVFIANGWANRLVNSVLQRE